MNQLKTQGRLIVKNLDRQIRQIETIGDSPTVMTLGSKARKAIIAYLGSASRFVKDDSEGQNEFYMGIPVRMSTKCLGEWTAHVSSLHSDGTVARATTDDPSIVALRQLALRLDHA